MNYREEAYSLYSLQYVHSVTALSHLANDPMTTIVRLLHSVGVVKKTREIVQSDNSTSSKILMKHMACMFAGRLRKRTRGGSSPSTAQPCNSERSVLMPFGNTAQGIFFGALMCPLSDSSVRRSSSFSSSPFKMITADFYINSLAFRC